MNNHLDCTFNEFAQTFYRWYRKVQTDEPSEKKNEEATINMVMVVTTTNKPPKEVAF